MEWTTMDEDRSGNRWISYVTSAPVSFPSPPHHVSLHLRSAPRVRREEVVNGMRNGSRMLAACPVCLSSLHLITSVPFRETNEVRDDRRRTEPSEMRRNGAGRVTLRLSSGSFTTFITLLHPLSEATGGSES